mgnify:CR=1 FL=1
MQSVNPFQRWDYTGKALPVDRQNLTYSNVNYVEHGKPVSLLVTEVSEQQCKPNGVQVEDGGKSECHSVMEWIEVETSLHTKVSRLPLGNSLQLTFRTFERRKANERINVCAY